MYLVFFIAGFFPFSTDSIHFLTLALDQIQGATPVTRTDIHEESESLANLAMHRIDATAGASEKTTDSIFHLLDEDANPVV